MKQFFMALFVGLALVGTTSAATIVQDPSGAVRFYADPSRGEFATTMDPPSDVLASSTPSVDADVTAKILAEPVCDEVSCQFCHYKTYYKPGDVIFLGATWRPLSDWGIPFSGREIDIQITLKKGSTIVYSDEEKSVLDDTDGGWFTVAFGHVVPEAAEAGDVYTLQVSLSVSGVNIVETHKPAPSRTKLYVIAEDPSDLPIPLMYGFEQRNWDWAEDRVGDCKATMEKEGWATTSKALVFGFFSYPDNLSPGQLNSCLRTDGGYVGGCLIPRDNADNLALVCAPSDVRWEGYYRGSHLSERIQSSLDSGFPVIAEAGQHNDLRYYVIAGRRGAHEWNVFDPLDGQIHTMESRGLTNSMIKGVYLYSHR